VKIKTRLILIVAVAIAVSLVIGYIGMTNLAKLNKDTASVTGACLPSVEKIINADRDLYQVAVARRELFDAVPGTPEWDSCIGEINENFQQVVDRVNGYEELATTDKQRDLIAQHESARSKWKSELDRYISLLEKGTPEARAQAKAMDDEMGALFVSVREPLDSLTEASLEIAENIEEAAKQDYTSARIATLIVLAAGIIILVFLSVAMIKSISGPIAEAVFYANKLAEGDLSRSPSSSSNDEMGELINALGKGINSIRALINNVADASEQVAASAQQLSASAQETTRATEQVATTVQDLSSAAQNQAEEVQNVSDTVQQMDEKMQNVAENLRSISELAQNTNKSSSNGSEFVKDATEQISSIKDKTDETSAVIKELGQKSKEIAKIVDMITNIADQTNLLALNAAIEAARAGEQGRGFAVVAEEVRKLAEESSKAAEEIAALINKVGQEAERAVATMEENTEKVKKGTEVIAKVDEIFGEIAGHIQELSTKVQDISGMVEEIASGSRDITKAMEHLTEISEQSSAGLQETASYTEEQNASMEEISSSAEKLAGLAQTLQEAVRQFNLGESSARREDGDN